MERTSTQNTDIQTSLALKARGGDQKAYKELIDLNQGIIHQVMKKFGKYCADRSSDLWEDLYQEGVLGIIQAVQRFDEKAGVKFLTYAHNYILKNISAAAYSRGPGAIRRTYYDIAKMLKDIEEGRDGQMKVVSLDCVLDDEERNGSTLYYYVCDKSTGSVEELTESKIVAENVRQAVGRIRDERVRRAIVGYFGLDGKKCRKTQDLAEEMGVSRSTVWNLITRGLKILSRSPLLWRPDCVFANS